MANLENPKIPKNDAYVEEAVDSNVDIPVMEDDELDWTLSDDEDESDDGETDIEADAGVEPEPIAEVKPKQSSKEERKIQALKAEAKKLQLEKAELQKKLEAKFDADATAELQKKYISAGYDEDEAKVRAKSEIEQTRLKEDMEQLKFQISNQELFRKYPKAQAELTKVMKAVQASGMTAEQVCRGLYGVQTPVQEQRAKDAVLGKLDNTDTDNGVATATRTASPKQKISLTESQIRMKQQLEKTYNKGKPISESEFVALLKKI